MSNDALLKELDDADRVLSKALGSNKPTIYGRAAAALRTALARSETGATDSYMIIEQCARICETQASMPGAEGQDTQLADHELRLCAERIRALKTPAPQDGTTSANHSVAGSDDAGSPGRPAEAGPSAPSATDATARTFHVCVDHRNVHWNQPQLDDGCILCRLFYLEAQEGLLEDAQQRAMRAENEIEDIKRPLDAQMARLNARVVELNGELESARSAIAPIPEVVALARDYVSLTKTLVSGDEILSVMREIVRLADSGIDS